MTGAHTDSAAVTTIVDRLAAEFEPERIILFGSRARGDAKADSDVDLLVVMPNGTDRRQAAIAMDVSLADLTTFKDIVVTTPDEIARQRHIPGGVLREALREGIVVHERS